MKDGMLHTPEANIAIAEVFAERGVVYLKFKKARTQVYEIVTLDCFLAQIYQTLEKMHYEETLR